MAYLERLQADKGQAQDTHIILSPVNYLPYLSQQIR